LQWTLSSSYTHYSVYEDNVRSHCTMWRPLNTIHMLQQTYNVKSGLRKIFFNKRLNQPLSDDRIFNL